MTRREFMMLGTATAGSLVAGCRMFSGGRETDSNLSVFVSDVHIRPDSYHIPRFARVVDEILAMNPRPARVVCFGDLAYLYGRRMDYEASRPQLMRLVEAGIELSFAMGNHDRREHFLEVWPEYRARLLLPDRIVSETSLGACDLVLLDTMWKDHEDETKMTKVNGELSAAQFDWLKTEVAWRKRPFFLGAHHPVNEIENGDWKALKDLIVKSPNCLGWIHGHDHAWKNGLLGMSDRKWNDNNFKRWLCLPSTGHWGDIGYVVVRTSPGEMRADLVMLDHYFPNPDTRTWLDDEIVREKTNAFCTFRW